MLIHGIHLLLKMQQKIVNVDLPEIQEVDTEAIAKNKAILGAQVRDQHKIQNKYIDNSIEQ